MTKGHCHGISVLTLALQLFLCQQLTATESLQLDIMKNQEECRKLQDSFCTCVQPLKYLNVNCPKGLARPKISISTQNNRVQIVCHDLYPTDYGKLLPNMTIGRKSMVHIRHCPLPPRQPLSNILQKLGITQVNELIYESNNLGKYLELIHFEGLQDLEKLKLSSNGLINLPENLFADLGNLTSLDLRSIRDKNNLNYRALHNLPPGIFRNLTKLIRLNVWSENLMHLTKETFEGVSSLTELGLSLKNTGTFRPDVFSLQTNITSVNLTENAFESLPDDLFAANKNLSSFRLYDNRVPLKQLPATLLGNLPNLREVRISCSLETIPDFLFVNSTAIRNITISGNNLTELPIMLFAHQIELIDLDLSRNQLISVPDEIFTYTNKLLVLRLSQNHLVNIADNMFFNLRNLQMLYVDNNNIITISPKAFSHTPKLTHIDMENNQIKLYDGEHKPTDQFDIRSPFQDLRELQTLNLKNNSIQRIFFDWKESISKLRTIDLSYNYITMISHYDFQFRSYDIFVNLSHNFIQKINFDEINEQDFKNLTRKIKVNLNYNPIDCDCGLLSFVKFVRKQIERRVNEIVATLYELKCNYPENLEGRLVGWLSPEELLCPLENRIGSPELCPESCSCWERPADQIAIVNCSNANLTEMPILPNLKHTRPGINGTELYIENNRLTKLPNASTAGYMHVVKLHASNNTLTEILDSNLPKNLITLNLSHNKIQHLNDTILKALNESRTISVLAGNPWTCDCSTKGLLRFVHHNLELIRDVKQLECVDGRKFHDLSLNVICSENENLLIAVCVLIAVVGLCAGIIASLYYKYQQEIKIWLYARHMCLWFVSEEELDRNKKYDAFISFSSKDEDFIVDYLLPELENGPTPFNLCLHSRDWHVGEFIPNQIVHSVDNSRRTIVVLSPNFIESNWARMEFLTAHTAAVKEGRVRVIAIVYGDIGNIDSLDDDLRAYLQMNTYIKWGDPWFWKKLRYAMPHSPKKSSIHDKLDKIKPSLVSHTVTTQPAEEASTNHLAPQLNGVAINAQ